MSAAQDIRITELEQFTENRGWNEAGLSPVYQLHVTATVVPSGYPTLVFVEQKAVRQPLSHFDVPVAPDSYWYSQLLDAALTGSWRIVARRGEGREASAWTPALAKPQQVPLVQDVFNARVSACGFQTAEQMRDARDETIAYFTTEYRKMPEENLDEYIVNFKKYMEVENG